VNNVNQQFASFDKKNKDKFFGNFVEHLGEREKSVSNLIESSHEVTQTVVYLVLALNSLAAFCVIYLFSKNKKTA
jgi:Na+/H+-dicarboxylate symporter